MGAGQSRVIESPLAPRAARNAAPRSDFPVFLKVCDLGLKYRTLLNVDSGYRRKKLCIVFLLFPRHFCARTSRVIGERGSEVLSQLDLQYLNPKRVEAHATKIGSKINLHISLIFKTKERLKCGRKQRRVRKCYFQTIKDIFPPKKNNVKTICFDLVQCEVSLKPTKIRGGKKNTAA